MSSDEEPENVVSEDMGEGEQEGKQQEEGGGEQGQGGVVEDNGGDKIAPVRNEDVFGDDDDDEEEQIPKKRSRLTQRDNDSASSGGSGSDSDESPKKRKKEKKSKKEKKEKRKREKEGKKSQKKRKTRGGGPVENNVGSDVEKERDVFANESDDEDAAINDGEVIDTETGETVKGDGKNKKLSKREKDELNRRENQEIMRFCMELRKAAHDDKKSFEEKKMATAKLLLLPKLVTELSNERKHQLYLESGVLEALKPWLEPLDGKKSVSSLPNRKVIVEVLNILLLLPIDEKHRRVVKAGPKQTNGETVDNLDFLTHSKIGHALSLVKHLLKEDKKCPAYRLATKLAQKWYRLVFKKADSFQNGDPDDDDSDNDDQLKKQRRSNREWEKMPDSLNQEGQKAVKGEFGFRQGASIPRPMLMDFTVMPKSKVDMGDVKERLKDRQRNETRARLANTSKEVKRAIVDGRNSRADQPELNRIHVGGVASKVASMGWADRT